MATIPRLYVSADLGGGAPVPLDEAQSKYLTRVLRLGIGDKVHVFNGRDGEWACKLANTSGRQALLEAERQLRPQPTTTIDLILAFAPLKKTRTDFVIEKATELGISAIQPVRTQWTQSDRIRPERLQKIALEAAEQTERLDLPEVRELISLEVFLSDIELGRTLYFCDEGGDAQPMRAALEKANPNPAAILIGPEGGFAPDERAQLRALDFVKPVTLGPRILRAETAVVSALTLWQAVLGDWD
ncbi:MAG: 16S rRNA (uracil(1498)-N(3))-methyltransferase [Hyphomonadaceae bacterium]